VHVFVHTRQQKEHFVCIWGSAIAQVCSPQTTIEVDAELQQSSMVPSDAGQQSPLSELHLGFSGAVQDAFRPEGVGGVGDGGAGVGCAGDGGAGMGDGPEADAQAWHAEMYDLPTSFIVPSSLNKRKL
jgi:hypothetical protein